MTSYDAKKVNFVEAGKYWLLFKLKSTFFGSKMRIPKIIFTCDIIMTSPTPYDTHPNEVIDHASLMFVRQTSLKKLRQTDEIALCVLNNCGKY